MKMTTSFKPMAVAGIALALAACGGGGDGDGSSGGGNPVVGQNGTVSVSGVSMSGGESCGISGFAQALLAEINAARAQARSCGSTAMPAVPAIGYWNTLLQHAAVKHSADMATGNFFSHTGSDGSSVVDRAAAVGYQGGVTENLMRVTGSNIRDIRVWMNSWLGSESHCQALMNSTIKEIGAACVIRGNQSLTTLVMGQGN